MNYEFDTDAKKFIKFFENEGYKINSAIHQTVHIRNSKGEAINAYTEPYIAHLVKDDIQIRLEFNLTHERASKKRKIVSITIMPKSLQLQDILKSKESLAEVSSELI